MLCIIAGHLGISEVNSVVFTFHVPIFFLISGYFLKDNTSLSDFIKKKFRQLIVPYIITCICIITGVSLKTYFLQSGNVVETIKTYVIASFYGSGTIEYTEPFVMKQIGAIWFLLALFFALIIVRFFMNYKYGGAAIVMIAYIGWKTTDMVWLPLSIQAGMTASLFVYAGMLFHKYNFMEKKLHPAIIGGLAGIWLICVIFGGRFYIVRNYFGNGLLDICGAFAGSYLILLLSKWIEKNTYMIGNSLEFLGRNSLLVLCSHSFELKMYWQWVWDFFGGQLGLTANTVYFILYLFYVLFCVACVFAIKAIQHGFHFYLSDRIQNWNQKLLSVQNKNSSQRIQFWDIAKGITITAVILGHSSGLPAYLRCIISSFHMPLFFIANGYFVKKYDVGRSLKRSARSLLCPYVVVCILSAGCYAVQQYGHMSTMEAIWIKIKAMLGGMSKISTKFTGFQSVWLVWFLCCLFLARNIYVLVMRLLNKHSDSVKLGVVFLLACIGYLIGEYYAFLPWSLDVALVALLFIMFGDWIRKTNFLDNSYAYILVIPAAIWIFFLYHGINIGMSTRSYPLTIGCVIEAIAGSLCIISISKLLSKTKIISGFLSWVGRNSIIILGIHCLEMMYFDWDKNIFQYLPFNMNWFRTFIIKTAVILFLTLLIDTIYKIFSRLVGRTS